MKKNKKINVKIFIVTQTFLPRVGGMQALMSSIAQGFIKIKL